MRPFGPQSQGYQNQKLNKNSEFRAEIMVLRRSIFSKPIKVQYRTA